MSDTLKFKLLALIGVSGLNKGSVHMHPRNVAWAIAVSMFTLVFSVLVVDAGAPNDVYDVPEDLNVNVMWELVQTHPNRGIQQQIALTFAARFPSDPRASDALFHAARLADLKRNSFTPVAEMRFLDGRKARILEEIAQQFPDTDHAQTARFFRAVDILNQEESNRRFGRLVDFEAVQNAINIFEALLQSDEFQITALPMLSFWETISVQGSGHAASTYNTAAAYEIMGELKKARELYLDYVSTYPGSRRAVIAEARVVIIQDSLTGLVVDDH